MNKFFKKIVLTFLSITLIVLSISSASAETIYEYYGFKYTIINNYSVSVCGRTESSNTLTIPNAIADKNVTAIGNRAFLNDTDITSINLSKAKSLSYIGMFAFSGCSNLNTKITLPENITKIGVAAFENCSSLNSVIFKASCNVPDQCFNKCTSLSSVGLNDSVESIGEYAFADCPNLTYIKLSENVKSIANSAFNNDSDLTIGCYYDTYAYEYAKAHNIPVEFLDMQYGDANADGTVNILDVTAIQKYKIGAQELNDYGMLCADVNHDGSVTVRDATLIQMKLAKYDVDF